MRLSCSPRRSCYLVAHDHSARVLLRSVQRPSRHSAGVRRFMRICPRSDTVSGRGPRSGLLRRRFVRCLPGATLGVAALSTRAHDPSGAHSAACIRRAMFSADAAESTVLHRSDLHGSADGSPSPARCGSSVPGRRAREFFSFHESPPPSRATNWSSGRSSRREPHRRLGGSAYAFDTNITRPASDATHISATLALAHAGFRRFFVIGLCREHPSTPCRRA